METIEQLSNKYNCQPTMKKTLKTLAISQSAKQVKFQMIDLFSVFSRLVLVIPRPFPRSNKIPNKIILNTTFAIFDNNVGVTEHCDLPLYAQS